MRARASSRIAAGVAVSTPRPCRRSRTRCARSLPRWSRSAGSGAPRVRGARLAGASSPTRQRVCRSSPALLSPALRFRAAGGRPWNSCRQWLDRVAPCDGGPAEPIRPTPGFAPRGVADRCCASALAGLGMNPRSRAAQAGSKHWCAIARGAPAYSTTCARSCVGLPVDPRVVADLHACGPFQAGLNCCAMRGLGRNADVLGGASATRQAWRLCGGWRCMPACEPR